MANKLSIITTQYHTYKVDQVLTHTQLNESIAFFEDQDRLTRVFLHGVGIVCGFRLSRPISTIIRLTQGIGVTTDGDLLKLLQESADPEEAGLRMVEDHVDYTHFRIFEDKNSDYSKFNQDDANINLWEIVPDDKKIETDQPLAAMDGLTDKIALLYLETYAREADMCSGINCDNQGVEQVAKLHVLLTDEEGAKHLMDNDGVYQQLDIKSLYRSLAKVKLPRVLLSKANTQELQKLEDSYYKAILDTDIEALSDGLTALSAFMGNEPNMASRINALQQKPNATYVNYFQYHYDWLRDVIATYHELIESLYRLNATCLPDINAFPKHLMLGWVDQNSAAQSYRHGFYKSPITGDTSVASKISLLLERMKLILSNYHTPSSGIKITPSVFKGNLGDKAIPFYYKPSNALLSNWNYEKTKMGRLEEIPRYQRAVDPATNAEIELLEYDSDEVDFYRIEGHQGQVYDQALIGINDLIYKYNLDFDVKAVSINEALDTIRMEDYKCHFEDLMVLLDAWNDEISCITGKITAFFSSLNLRKILAESAATNPAPANTTGRETFGTKNTGKETMTLAELALLIKAKKITLAEAQRLYPYLFESTKDYKTENSKSIRESVFKNIKEEENTLGTVFLPLVKTETPVYFSYNDVKVEAEKEVANYLKDIQVDQEVKLALVDKPIEIIAASYDIANFIPERLFELDRGYILDYENSIESLCKKLEEFSKRIEKTRLNDKLKANYQSQALFFTSVCCAANKLKILQAEIEARKKLILEQLQLSNFHEHHPGLDHRAGVTKGGTFVMVYYTRPSRVRPSVSIAGFRDISIADAALGSRAVDFNKIIKDLDLFTNPVNLEKDLATFRDRLAFGIGDFALPDLLQRRPLKSNLKDKTVIADFMLPYRCCADCNPVNFIVPRPVVFLNLSTETFCLGLDQEPITFEVIPEDGTVTVADGVPGVIISGNSISIDPELFSSDMIGQPIAFYVNDEPTDARLQVYQAPVFALNLPDGPVTSPVVTLSATGNFDGASYRWDFGDGTSSTLANPTKTYTLPVNDSNTVTVSLTITPANGACPKTISGEIVFEELEEEVGLTLEPTEFCRTPNSTPVPFGITPEGARVEGPGVQQTTNGYVFNPQLVGDIDLNTALKFRVNGQEADLVVRVFTRPILNFSHSVTNNPTNASQIVNLTITNPPTSAKEYVWSFDGQQEAPVTQTTYQKVFERGAAQVQVMVRASLSTICETAESTLVTIPLGRSEPLTCIDISKQWIEEQAKRWTEFLASERFKSVDDWGQEIIARAIQGGTGDNGNQLMGIAEIAKHAEAYLKGEDEQNKQLVQIFPPQLEQLVMYIIEMAPGNGPGVAPANDLYKIYVQLFYTLLKCQDTNLLIERGPDFQFGEIVGLISQQFKRLQGARIKWDEKDQIPPLYDDLMVVFEKVDYLIRGLQVQLTLLV